MFYVIYKCQASKLGPETLASDDNVDNDSDYLEPEEISAAMDSLRSPSRGKRPRFTGVLSEDDDVNVDEISANEEDWRSGPPTTSGRVAWQPVPGDGEKLQFRYTAYYDLAARRPRSQFTTTGNVSSVFDFFADDDELHTTTTARKELPVQPKKPDVAAWVSSKYMTPAAIHECLVGLLAETISSGMFLTWNDNFCHFDSVLMLNLVAYCRLGMAYWTNADGTTRAVSYPERCTVDLLCAFSANIGDTVRKALRNNYMWEVLSHDPNEGIPCYGGLVDAMLHAYVAGCKADEYHGVKIRPSVVTHKPCQCRDGIARFNEELKGCIAVHRAETLAVAFHNAVLLGRTGAKSNCKLSIPNDKSTRPRTRTRICDGKYSASVESVMLGALLCIDVELHYVVNVESAMVLLLGPLEYNLVGVALWDGGHYKCRFVVDSVWYEYNDLGHGNGTTVKVVRNPHIVPRSWHVRGLWYARTSGNCQPQEAWQGSSWVA